MPFLKNFFSSMDMEPLVQFFAPYPKTDKPITETEQLWNETEKPLTDTKQDVDENELPDYVKYLDLRFPFTLVEHMKRPPLTNKTQNGEESCEHKSDAPENAEPSYDSDTPKEKLTMQAETVEPSYDLFAPTDTELPEPTFSPYSENVKQKQLEEQLAYKARFDEAMLRQKQQALEVLVEMFPTDFTRNQGTLANEHVIGNQHRYATSTQMWIQIREYVGDPMDQFVSQNVVNQNGNDCCFMTSI